MEYQNGGVIMEKQKLKINGEYYPMWSQLIEQKVKWIGGKLLDEGDSIDKMMGYKPKITLITNISLKPNGEDSAFFSIVGEDFTCGFDCKYGGISGDQVSGWLTFSGYGHHVFKIKEKG